MATKTTENFVAITDAASHDLNHIKRLIEMGRIRDDEALKAIVAICDETKQKALDEATSIQSHPVLFGR